jgi:molecular chaperone HscB
MKTGLDQDFFDLFGLPHSFDVDMALVNERYRALQRELHPDRYASAPDQARRLAVQMTARVNEALQTLKDPLRRARYMLALAGMDTDDDTDTRVDPGFLMEQMELREALAEARGATDASAKLATLSTQVNDAVAQRIATIRDSFGAAEPHLDTIRAAVRELQFLRKLQHELEAAEDDLY